MALTITDVQRDLPKLNSELTRLDEHERRFRDLELKLNNLSSHSAVESKTNGVQNQNNVAFVWTGGTLTISWAAAYVKDHQGHYDPIPAGSQVALPNTFYWAGWNPVHLTMSFNTNLDQLTKVENVLVLCQFFTGTGGQTGTLGGGGSVPNAQGLNGERFKNF
jgi:hypothetical protein